METSEEKVNIVYEKCLPSWNPHIANALNRSDGERISIKARQKKVCEALQRLGINVTKTKEPPIIALSGSGGGLRAMVGLLGTISELANEDLLDAITYVCGVSGSTWCLSSLYNNDKWSSCMAEMECEISDRLVNSTWSRRKAWEKLEETFSSDIYSLTNFWAYVVVHKITKYMDEKTLSYHRASCESGENPYPVYAAVEKKRLYSNEPGTWFEFTPHLAGFPAYNTFVNTELLGSQFKEGKLLKNHPEKDLCYLQGLWGSAPSGDDFIQNAIKAMIQKLFPDTRADNSEEIFCSCEGCLKIMSLLSNDLANITDEKIEMFYHDLTTVLDGAVENISDDDTLKAALHADLRKSGSCERAKIMLRILKCFMDWNWGTINNFLYEWKRNVPDDLCGQEFISLIDAGLEINAAYPLMLPPNRQIDLILSFDYSEGDPFMTLKSTAEYCKTNGIPFPNIIIEDQDIPSKSCYIFEGDDKGTPIVMHFPLFNNQNCEGKVHEMRELYATRKLSYNKSELNELLRVSKFNVQLSKNQILEKLQQCVNCK